jgi:hypothetical protein
MKVPQMPSICICMVADVDKVNTEILPDAVAFPASEYDQIHDGKLFR